jgi:hypothetical protein
MGYDKPKVTIDLAEYNELLELKKTKIEPSEAATLAFNAGFQFANQHGTGDMWGIINKLCQDVNYRLDIRLKHDGGSNGYSGYGTYGVVKIVEKDGN